MLASDACLIPAATTHSASTAVACLTASLFFLEMVIGPAWAVPMDVGGEYGGTVPGVMNIAVALWPSGVSPGFGFFSQRGSGDVSLLLASRNVPNRAPDLAFSF